MIPVACRASLYLPVTYLYDPPIMGQLEKAREILTLTETSLRDLIERALSEQEYGEVANIAQMADAVARLVRQNGDASRITPAATHPSSRHTESQGDEPTTSDAQAETSKPTRKRRPAKGEYPRFERDGDKLIKIGWSKRDERVYEHRAPREIVFLLTNVLSSKRPKSVFAMEQVLPLNDNAGHEIPSYQAYLALAWLRSIGAVQRRGKDGYAVTNGSLESAKLQRLWNAIPTRH